MGKNELILGLVRYSFLTVREKTFLAKNLDNLESLTVLSIEDICQRIGRTVRTGCRVPERLSALVQQDMDVMQRFGIRFVSALSAEYPPLLREIHDPPFAIFWRGTLPDPERPLAGIVGTRAPSGDGALAAARLGREFGAAGIGVVSGLARGIDAFAHRGNIEGGGATVAVLACGLERIYPRSNIRLAARIIETGGCLLGEFPPGDEPFRFHFPQRNRIISGLSRAVLVVEAPEKSGALITADFALEQGRDLFVYDGTLSSARGAGTSVLHAEGAPAIESAGEILESWGYCSRPETGPGNMREPGGGNRELSRSVQAGRQLALDFRKETAFR